MKYRLLELLTCPSHPEPMLRVTGAQLSDVFPYGGEIQIPVCRAGCGMLGNWFDDIPESLPPHHRFDCRRCMGTEIESASLTCPECGWYLEVRDGVILAGSGEADVKGSGEDQISARAGGAIEKHFKLQPGEISLILAPIPDSTLRTLCGQGVERLQVEVNIDDLLSGRALSCTNGHGTAHHLCGPMNISIIRPGSIDAIIMKVPGNRLIKDDHLFEAIHERLKPSGRTALIYPSGTMPGKKPEKLAGYLSELPPPFHEMIPNLVEVPGYDLLFLNPAGNGNGNGNGHGNGNGG